jgi:hypothetical protein
VTAKRRRGEVVWLLARDGGYGTTRLEARQLLAMVTKVWRIPSQCRTTTVRGVDDGVRRDFYIGFSISGNSQLIGFMLQQTEYTYRASRSGFVFLGVISAIAAVTLVKASGVELDNKVLQGYLDQEEDIC